MVRSSFVSNFDATPDATQPTLMNNDGITSTALRTFCLFLKDNAIEFISFQLSPPPYDKMVIPHAEIPISNLRPNDILLLLGLGALMELMCRMIGSKAKVPSSSEVSTKATLFKLRMDTAKAKKKGPSAFVETSKLERKVLALERELNALSEVRKGTKTAIQSRTKRMRQMFTLVLFLVYYGIPVMVLDGLALSLNHPTLLHSSSSAAHDEVGVETQCATAFYKAILFPISYIGIGMKLAKFGCPSGGSVGALVVYWSAQVTVGKIYDCCEILYLQ